MTSHVPRSALNAANPATVVTPPILVVDDSRAHRRLLSKSLSRWGYQTVEADSGEEALEICKSTPIDLVISDWMMPGMSGVEFCRAFRDIRAGKPGYFILLTAQTDRDILAEGLESGADDFLSKPFNAVELKARIRAGERLLNAQRDMDAKNLLLSETLMELRVAQAAIDRDLKEARRFQHALVPERYLALNRADISLLYQPSGHVGGDLVGMFRVSENRYGVYSVDVSGHGIASSLMTARIAGHLSASSPDRNIALTTDDLGIYSMHPPEKVCAILNDILMQQPDTDQYLTMLLADIDFAEGSAIVAQAGHPSPVVQRADGEVQFTSCFGLPIGLIEGAEYTSFRVDFAPGDRFLLYSDGITECPDPKGVLLDESGLAEILRRSKDLKGRKLLSHLVCELESFSGLSEFPDDLSAILVEFRGNSD